MDTNSLEEQIAQRRRQAEERCFRHKALVVTSSTMRHPTLSFGRRNCVRNAPFWIETYFDRGGYGLTSSTIILFRRKRVFEQQDFTVVLYIPGEEWERELDVLYRQASQLPRFTPHPSERRLIVTDEVIQATQRKMWGL